MNLNQLAEKALRGQVNLASGAGEQVDYVHGSSDRWETVKCYPQLNEEEATDSTHISNSMMFRGLFLDEKPTKSDIIKYNGIDWKIDDIRSSVGGYDILAYNKKHGLGVRG